MFDGKGGLSKVADQPFYVPEWVVGTSKCTH